VVEQGDAAIAIDGASVSEAEDVFGGSIRLGQGEAAEEAVAGLFGAGKTDRGDFSGGRMDLVIIVALDFFVQDRASVRQGGDVFQGAGADNPILEPTIGSFDLAFGLGREGIDNIHPEQAQTGASLGIDLIRFENVFAPQAIPVLDEAENP